MTCVYKEHETKTKKVSEQWPQLKIKFSLGYITWKLLFSEENGDINLWWGGGIKIWWEGGLLGRLSQVGGMSKFPAGGRGLPPILPSRKIYIYIYTPVPACVLIPLAILNPAIFSVSPEVLKNLISCPRQTKSLHSSNLLLTFNNNTYIDFRKACKHVLIPTYFIPVI